MTARVDTPLALALSHMTSVHLPHVTLWAKNDHLILLK